MESRSQRSSDDQHPRDSLVPHPDSLIPGVGFLPDRPKDGHKGTFGTVAVIGGSCGGKTVMAGAPALSAMGALRAGCGLAKIVAPAALLPHCLTICPSATGMVLPCDDDGIIAHEAAAVVDGLCDGKSVQCVAVGPGLGTSEGARATVLRCVQQEDAAVVVDADGLNCLAQTPDLFRDLHAMAVLTPHPGEFRRLCEGLGLTNALGLDSSREEACTRLAQRLGCVVVLKGARTVVSDGMRTWVCETGHACMATGGTGDVLTGIIAGVIAQYCASPREMVMRAKAPAMPVNAAKPLDLYDAARVGVWVHGRCGEEWARTHGASGGMLAMELGEFVPRMMEELREQEPF